MATKRVNEGVQLRHVLGELHELFDPPRKKRRAAAASCWVMQARGLTLEQRYELCCKGQRREPAAAAAESDSEATRAFESGLESDSEAESRRPEALGVSRNTKVAVYVAAPSHDDDGEGPDDDGEGPDE